MSPTGSASSGGHSAVGTVSKTCLDSGAEKGAFHADFQGPAGCVSNWYFRATPWSLDSGFAAGSSRKVQVLRKWQGRGEAERASGTRFASAGRDRGQTRNVPSFSVARESGVEVAARAVYGDGGCTVSGGGVGVVGGGGGGLAETYFCVQAAMWLEVVRSWNGRKKPG